jgi:hypothetical protein
MSTHHYTWWFEQPATDIYVSVHHRPHFGGCVRLSLQVGAHHEITMIPYNWCLQTALLLMLNMIERVDHGEKVARVLWPHGNVDVILV